MTEWKTPASEEEWEVEETRKQPVWVRDGRLFAARALGVSRGQRACDCISPLP